jgi:tetratricopeptide (TPR) repeat protein
MKPLQKKRKKQRPPRPLRPIEKVLVIVLLALGMASLAALARKGPPRHTYKQTPSPSATPAARLTVEQVREGFASNKPFNAVRAAIAIVEATEDPIVRDQALQELDEHLEGLDRLGLYKVFDDYHKKADSPRAKDVDRFLAALAATKSFFFERHDPAKAEKILADLAENKASPMAAPAINKLASLKVSDDPKRAIELYRRQIEEFPASPLNGFASLMIGTCMRALDRDREALEQYKRTLARYKNAYAQRGLPLEPFVRHALGDTYIRLGDRDSARGELNVVKERFKEYPYMGMVEETLKTMGS